MRPLPEGVVTFLFTDVEGSTRLLELHGDAMGSALARHHDLLDHIVSQHGGVVFETIGDAVYAAFARPRDATAAALEAQLALAAEDWEPIGRLAARMAIHTGPVVRRGTHYFGPALFRAARLQSLGFGEQTLISGTTAASLADEMPDRASLQSLGSHRLKDLGEPEHVYQLVHPDLRAEFPPVKSIDARPHNLPVHLSSFVGRDRELRVVQDLLADHRLVTLLGEGGIGKTRLALQAAADQLDHFEDGVFFVDLAALRDPELVPGAIARTLGLRERAGETPSATAAEYLRERSALLVLDNLEHLLPAASASVSELLAACPMLRLIATSRAPLRVNGEQRYRVQPLAVGSPDEPDVVLPPAVALFAERARALNPSFEIDVRTGPAVADICRRLDGLPLAIELAAQRLHVFGVDQLRDRLSRRFDLLQRAPGDAPERQRTIRTAIAWSEELLTLPQRRCFRRLGLFVSPFTVNAAIAIGVAEPTTDPVADLEALVESSLLRRSDEGGEARLTMLQTIREHALDRLESSGEVEDAVVRSIAFWADEAEAFLESILNPKLAGGRRRGGAEAAMERMVRDFPNARAGLRDAIARGNQLAALRIISGISIVWVDRGPWREGVELCEAAFALGELPVSTLAGDALHRAAMIATRLGDRRRARSLGLRALSMRRRLGNPDKIESTLTNLTRVADTPVEALTYVEECLEIKRRLGTETQDSLADLGFTHLVLDDTAAGERAFGQALDEARRVGDHYTLSVVEHALGRLAAYRDDLAQARSRFEHAREEAEAGGEPWAAAAALGAVAECDLREDRSRAALERLADAVSLVPADEWELHPEDLVDLLFSVVAITCRHGDGVAVAEICGVLATARATHGRLQLAYRQRELGHLSAACLEGVGADRYWSAWWRGRAMTLDRSAPLLSRAIRAPGLRSSGDTLSAELAGHDHVGAT